MAKRISNKEFIDRANKIHGDTYDYDNTVYENMRSSITITCSKHGNFEQTASNHLKGSGCPQCGYDKREDGKILRNDPCYDPDNMDNILEEYIKTSSTLKKKEYQIFSSRNIYKQHESDNTQINGPRQDCITLSDTILYKAVKTGRVIATYRYFTKNHEFIQAELNEEVDWGLISQNPNLNFDIIIMYKDYMVMDNLINNPYIKNALNGLINKDSKVYTSGIVDHYLKLGNDINTLYLSNDMIDVYDTNWLSYLIYRSENSLPFDKELINIAEVDIHKIVLENKDPHNYLMQALPERFIFDGEKIIPKLQYFDVIKYMHNNIVSDEFLDYVIDSRLENCPIQSLYSLISITQLPSIEFIEKHIGKNTEFSQYINVVNMFIAGHGKGKSIDEKMIDKYLDAILTEPSYNVGQRIHGIFTGETLLRILVHGHCTSNAMKQLAKKSKDSPNPSLTYTNTVIKQVLINDIKSMLDGLINPTKVNLADFNIIQAQSDNITSNDEYLDTGFIKNVDSEITIPGFKKRDGVFNRI